MIEIPPISKLLLEVFFCVKQKNHTAMFQKLNVSKFITIFTNSFKNQAK